MILNVCTEYRSHADVYVKNVKIMEHLPPTLTPVIPKLFLENIKMHW